MSAKPKVRHYRKNDDLPKLHRFMEVLSVVEPRGGIHDAGLRILDRFRKVSRRDFAERDSWPGFLDHLTGFVEPYRSMLETDALYLVSQPYGVRVEEHGNFCTTYGLVAYVFGRDWAWHNDGCDLVVFVQATNRGLHHHRRLHDAPWRTCIRPSFTIEHKVRPVCEACGQEFSKKHPGVLSWWVRDEPHADGRETVYKVRLHHHAALRPENCFADNGDSERLRDTPAFDSTVSCEELSRIFGMYAFDEADEKWLRDVFGYPSNLRVLG